MRALLVASLLLFGCIQAPSEMPAPDGGVDVGAADLTMLDIAEDATIGADTATDAAADADSDSGPTDMAGTCSDGLLNQTETDVDCGGSCDVCALGQACRRPRDCGEGFCIEGTCDWPTSCAQYQELRAGNVSADYRIDPDGFAGIHDSLEVWCDMEADGGVGYTMRRFDEPSLGAAQEPYRQSCASVGLELIVPRSWSHALGIVAYNGSEPNLIGVYPKMDGAQRLDNYTGRCGGAECSFYVTDRTNNNSECGANDEPSGDSTTADALHAIAPPVGECPLGEFNDEGDLVRQTGYVLCSTNDAGPPKYTSCLEINAAGSMQQTENYGPNGMYTIERSVGDVEVYCDFRDDGGGYTYKKIQPAMRMTSPQAEGICSQTYGMQLFAPRTLAHLHNALGVGADATIPPAAGMEYVRLMGVYPIADGANCGAQPMNSDNANCEFRALNDAPFWVHATDAFAEPNGDNNELQHSLVYSWERSDAASPIRSIEELGATADTAEFICVVGDKLGP